VTRRENFVLIVELPDHEISLKSGEMVVIKPARLRSVTTCVDSTIFSDGNGVSETVWSADGRCHHTNEFEAIELDDNKFALAVTNFPLSRVEARGIRSSRDKLRAKCLNDAKQAQIDAMKDMEPTWEEKPRFEVSIGSSTLVLVSDISREFSREFSTDLTEKPQIKCIEETETAWEEKPRFEMSIGTSKLVFVSDLRRGFADLTAPTLPNNRVLTRSLTVP